MKTFIIFTDSIRYARRGFGGRTVTKRHELKALDIMSACDNAIALHPGSRVSMVWEDWK